MSALRESVTKRTLWVAAAVGSFVLILGVGLVLAAPPPNITICHNGQSIAADAHSLAAHARHGDSLGACDQVCPCPFIFDPVTCSSNGQTYVNPCGATCAGAKGCVRPGVCACPFIWDPVVCPNGITYANLCVAECNGAPNDCGRPPGCACPFIFDPVTCESDGQTYASLCVAECNGSSSCTGDCEFPVCACPAVFDPVFCTSNGVSYANLCLAQCDRDGACEAPTGCTRFSACGCPLITDPVTCSDGVTYPNQCVATCAGATGCSPPCSDCPEVPPDFGTSVLCTTGSTYPNQCNGICAGEECYYSDNAVICDPSAGCSGGGLFAPVICPNGASYVNADLATCCLHGATAGCRDGACLFTCPSAVHPVICANGKTYVNECFANCDGATGCAP